MNAVEAAEKLTEFWPQAKTTPAIMDGYQRIMEQVPEEMRDKLIKRLSEDNEFLPSIFQVRQTWKSIAPPTPPPVEATERPTSNAKPDWIDGCYKCSEGVIQAPPLPRREALYLERIAQMEAGEIEFCDCKAGRMYRIGLMNARQKEVEWMKKVGLAAQGERKKGGIRT